MDIKLTPKAGVGVMILKDGKVLITKRKSSHGAGQYAFPGGHLEYMESFEECAIRETREECGIEIKNIQFQFLANLKKYAPKHYVHIGLIAEWASGEAQTLEPEKSEDWVWYDVDKLPQGEYFETCTVAFDAFKNNKNYYPSL